MGASVVDDHGAWPVSRKGSVRKPFGQTFVLLALLQSASKSVIGCLGPNKRYLGTGKVPAFFCDLSLYLAKGVATLLVNETCGIGVALRNRSMVFQAQPRGSAYSSHCFGPATESSCLHLCTEPPPPTSNSCWTVGKKAKTFEAPFLES